MAAQSPLFSSTYNKKTDKWHWKLTARNGKEVASGQTVGFKNRPGDRMRLRLIELLATARVYDQHPSKVIPKPIKLNIT